MEPPNEQDITTGRSAGAIPILAKDGQGTAENSKPAQTRSGSASIESVSGVLALLQNDCSELQSQGLKIAILARENKLYLVMEYPKHELGFDTGTGHFLVDGVPVLKAMEAE